MKHLLSVCYLLMFLSSGVLASPPVPDKKITEQKEWVSQPKKLLEEANSLSKKKKTIESDLKKLRSDLKAQASDLQSYEEDLKHIIKEITKSERGLKEHRAYIEQQKSHIASLIVSLVKMDAVPQDVLMLLPPEKSENLMVSYHTLKALHPELEKQISNVEDQMKQLEAKKMDLKDKTEAKTQTAASLKEKKEKLSQLIRKRQKDYSSTSLAFKEMEKKALYASKTAKNLDELVAAVKQKNDVLQKEAVRVETKKAPSKVSYVRTSTKRLPVKGDLLTRYGDKDRIGAKSKGLEIRGIGGGVVIAPKSGAVKYAGDFRKYGRIILIEHGKNYHSLIAGLDKIDTVVGQNVSEGAPIGYIGGRAGQNHTVYYELRLNGKPVNPLTHLSKL